jgi:hypothetical protein
MVAQKQKDKKSKRKKPKVKVCDSCGYENEAKATKCIGCGKQRFAPEWVLAKRPINRQVSVDVTLSNPQYGTQHKRITLSKWWPGDKANFHLPNPQQWMEIRQYVEELYPVVGWKIPKTQVEQVKQRLKTGKSIDASLQELVNQYPDLLTKLGKALDPKNIAKRDVPDLVNALVQQADLLSKGTAGFRESYVAVLKKLPIQPKKAFEQLENLLENWSLQQITSVAQTIKSRIETLELFRTQIKNERTFEIRGDNSIHRILENAMWMIDERYFLLKSNKSLREFIGEEMSKRDKNRYGKKRPDFVCGSVGERLIIIELKRPSKVLNIEDLNQLETYLTVVESYATKYRSHEAYLIGNKQDDDLIKRSKYRSSIFRILTYTDLIDATETRYQEYLKHIQS